ncbi:DUF3592 domain-containing protein [Methyloversatilis discipulorum]|uniref:DUF3592 domain-containing protein n=1 Tax=Methyloversatilis discipulorum TaxID=1119528 RepID=UPI001A55F03F|nr:DUF3592 domain-containing protein [Methyloversatilis discipulorum]MBL8467277.1 DUF3592 domain-containing protein [Methyloversatilis discipulorum]
MSSDLHAQASRLLDQLGRGLRWPMLLLGLLLVISTAWSGWHEFIRHATSDRMRAVSGQIEHFSARLVRRAETGLPAGPGIMVEQLELEFSARYEVAGRGYQTSRYSLAHGNRFTPGSPEALAMSEVIAAWTPGGRVSLWVDPEQPALAVIDKRISPEDALPVALLTALGGLLALGLAWRGFRKQTPRTSK